VTSGFVKQKLLGHGWDSFVTGLPDVSGAKFVWQF